MAEALGVAGSVVGIASFAIQLGDGILKLKSFWEAVKDAPEEILYMLDELDTTHLLLTEIENNLGHQTLSPAAAKSLRLCQQGMNILNTAVKDLDREMRKRKKWGSVKMVLKKELLENMEKRLGRANSLMMMAHQNYIHLNNSRHDEQVRLAMLQYSEIVELRSTFNSFDRFGIASATQQQKLCTDTSNLSSTSIKEDSTSGSKVTKAMSKHQKIINAKLRLPFFSGVWELCGYRQSTSGWMFTLRTYNVVDGEAPIIVLARDGNIAEMQQLFQTRQASPFDVDIYGLTPLHWAAMEANRKACQFLIDQGADPNAEDCFGNNALDSVFHFSSLEEETSETFQHLYSRTECYAIITLPDYYNSSAVLDIPFGRELLSYQLRKIGISIPEQSFRERALLVLSVSYNLLSGSYVKLVRALLESMDTKTCVENLNPLEIYELLNNIARKFGYEVLNRLGNGERKMFHADANGVFKVTIPDELDEDLDSTGSLEDILSLMHDILLTNSTVQVFSLEPSTCTWQPLMTLIYTALYNDRESPVDLIGIWLDQLTSAGVDLVEYGRWEKAMHIRRYHEYEYEFIRLISFTYGPKRSDWQFWFTKDPEYIYFDCLAEFYDMIEHPERQIPGAWNF